MVVEGSQGVSMRVWPDQAPRSIEGVLRALVTLHALRRLEADMGALLTEGLLGLEAARAIPAEIRWGAPLGVLCVASVCVRACPPSPSLVPAGLPPALSPWLSSQRLFHHILLIIAQSCTRAPVTPG